MTYTEAPKRGIQAVVHRTLLSAMLMVVLLCPFAPAQWAETNGFFGGTVTCFARAGPYLFVGTAGNGVFLTTDNGASWRAASSGLTNHSVWDLAVLGTNLFAGGAGGVFRSTDSGSTWTAANAGMTTVDVRCLAIMGTNLFAGTSGGGVFCSRDSGASWNAANTGLTRVFISSFAVRDPYLFAGTDWGYVFRSTDNGASWTRGSIPLQYTNVTAIAVMPFYVFAVCSGKIYRSDDGGATWKSLSTSDLTLLAVWSFAVAGGNLFAGGRGGVSVSADYGAHWKRFNLGLTDSMSSGVNALTVVGTDIFAGTNSKVWKRPLAEIYTSAENMLNDGPKECLLLQNYPNPFNPTTTIKYELSRSSDVRLSVYDLLGREVSVLVDERRDAGIHEVNLDASGMSSGMYLYRLQAGDFVQAKKLVVLK